MLQSSKLIPASFIGGHWIHKDLPFPLSPTSKTLSYRPQPRGSPHRRPPVISLAISSQRTGELTNFNTLREEDPEEYEFAYFKVHFCVFARCTKRLLEWEELCTHVGRFAQTNAGKRACRKLKLASSCTEALHLQNETKAVEVLEAKLKVEFKFGNTSTELMEGALRRCRKGGLLTAEQLMSISALLSTTRVTSSYFQPLNPFLQDLKKVILAPFRKTGLYKDLREAANVVYSPWKRVEIPLELKTLIDFAIDSEGNLKDNATPVLSNARTKYRSIRNRVETLMKSFKGKVVQRSGR